MKETTRPLFPDKQDDAITRLWVKNENLVKAVTERWQPVTEKDQEDDGLIRETPEQRQHALAQAQREGFARGREEAIQALKEELRPVVHQEIYDASYLEGKQAGHTEGYRNGIHEAQVEVDHQIALLKELYREMHVWQCARDKRQLKDLQELISAMARKVVMTELKLQPDTINRAISGAIRMLPTDSDEIPTIILNPADRERVEKFKDSINAKWHIHVDSNQHAGGCYVEASQNAVNASFELRLEQSLQALIEVFGEEFRNEA
ncbi:FliH/SctL family protein [Sansalvadorimonas sp. 2012CJ34-2]|uniref:Flagellar assembly protein FliH n=1 Tax=Parendozoicomonas callyspongiae TaxID=2942213 RepID=A0ABT0PFG9_9GAMM|nr:FliH/SctL family protein [Sansalvadorimonas sp. 2012CJ34-2]MCL6270122.1 FliH/SctL family protein [Sansalvadorimonas sp. 2012CJ34-2]